MNELEIKQQQHEQILRQMKIANAITAVIAIAALGGAISFIAKIFK